MRSSDRPVGAVWRLLEDWARREQASDRFGRKITQGDMAKLFGVSGQTVSAWKRCVARMQMAEQIAVVKNTDITHAELAAALAEDEPRIAEAIATRSDLAEAARRVALRAEQDNSTIFADIEVEEGPDEPAAAVVDRYLNAAACRRGGVFQA